MDNDTEESETSEQPARPDAVEPIAPSLNLPAAVANVFGAWWGDTTTSIGPLLSSQAYNALSVAITNLKAQLAATLH